MTLNVQSQGKAEDGQIHDAVHVANIFLAWHLHPAELCPTSKYLAIRMLTVALVCPAGRPLNEISVFCLFSLLIVKIRWYTGTGPSVA